MLALRFLGSLFLLIAVISLTADLSRPAGRWQCQLHEPAEALV